MRRDVDAHLGECPKCRNAAEELTYISQSLALVLSWIFVGGSSAAALLTSFGTPTAQAAVLAVPPLAEGTTSGFGAAGAGSSGTGGAAAAAGGTAVSASGIVLTTAASVLALAVAGAAVIISTAPQSDATIASAPEHDQSRPTLMSSDAESNANDAATNEGSPDESESTDADDAVTTPLSENEQASPPFESVIERPAPSESAPPPPSLPQPEPSESLEPSEPQEPLERPTEPTPTTPDPGTDTDPDGEPSEPAPDPEAGPTPELEEKPEPEPEPEMRPTPGDMCQWRDSGIIFITGTASHPGQIEIRITYPRSPIDYSIQTDAHPTWETGVAFENLPAEANLEIRLLIHDGDATDWESMALNDVKSCESGTDTIADFGQ